VPWLNNIRAGRGTRAAHRLVRLRVAKTITDPRTTAQPGARLAG